MSPNRSEDRLLNDLLSRLNRIDWYGEGQSDTGMTAISLKQSTAQAMPSLTNTPPQPSFTASYFIAVYQDCMRATASFHMDLQNPHARRARAARPERSIVHCTDFYGLQRWLRAVWISHRGVTAATSRNALSGRRRRGLRASPLARRYHEGMFSLILTFCLSAVVLSVMTYTVLRPLKVTVATLPRRPTAYS